MKIIRFGTVLILLLSISGCGVDQFFIERGINKIDVEIEDQLNDFADLTPTQKQQATAIALATESWVRISVLPRAASLIGEIASDVETTGVLPKNTYDKVVEFAYRPAQLSTNRALIGDIAKLFYELDPQQDQQVVQELTDNHAERLEKRNERTLETQKDGIAKSLKTVFRGMGVARDASQLAAMRTTLEQRIDLSEQTNTFYNSTNANFIELAQNKGDSFEQYFARYVSAWQRLEAGPSSAYPNEFAHNANNGFEAISVLFNSLDKQEQLKVVEVLREYQLFLTTLSTQD